MALNAAISTADITKPTRLTQIGRAPRGTRSPLLCASWHMSANNRCPNHDVLSGWVGTVK